MINHLLLIGFLLTPRGNCAPVEAKPKIAVVIDDFGLTYKKNVPDDEWMKITWPVTFADMPESPRTKIAAQQTLEHKHELIIHFPFDPFLSLDLPPDQASAEDVKKVTQLLDKAFKEIPGAVGLNNHRSYKATKNRPLMREFMRLFKPKGIYFVDSHVSAQSVAFDEAKQANIPTAQNFIFLEENKHHEKEFTIKMLRRAAAYAKKHGSVLVIGHHYFHGTYEGLMEEVPKLQAEGFEFVFASQVVK